MSTTIDNKVVEMRFDNKQFESNVSTTMSTLDKLKQSLKLDGATKGLQDVDSAARKCDMSGLGGAVETVRAKFSALQVMGITALANITNSAVNAGKRIVSALTIDPIKTGLQEYETQINAVQTILANTESKGSTLKDVNSALDELNTYADKTIYNFTEMTRNIGTFTAAGVDLDTSVSAIQGIANLAAVSGSNSQQASTAMYQLSQALSSGTVKLQDWNSVVNAGMGGQVFQDALKRTATVMGTNVDALIEKNGSFRESLQEGWITADVLTKTLNQFTMAAEEGSAEWKKYKKSLMDDGYTAKQAEEILKMANTATDAATKVKTFTQLWDTLKETAQSGWTQTWEIIMGDFEEAKELFSDLYNTFSPMIDAMSKARNELLEGWAEAGGRTHLIDSLYNIIDGISSIVKPIKEAFREIFPPMTVKQLTGFTKGLVTLTEKLKLSETTSNNLKRTFKGVFALLDIGVQVIKALFKGFGKLLGFIAPAGDGLLGFTARIGDFIVGIDEAIKSSNVFNKIIEGIGKFLKPVAEGVKSFGKTVGKALGSVADKTKERFEPFTILGELLKSIFVGLGAVLGKILPFIATAATSIGKAIGGIISKITDAIQNADFNQLFDLVNGGVFTAIGIFIAKFFKQANDIIEDGASFKESISDILDGVSDSLNAFTGSLKAQTLKTIAVAIAILAASLLVLSLIDSKKLTTALVAISVVFIELMGAMKLFTMMIDGKTFKGIGRISRALVTMSIAILILSAAMVKLGSLSWGELAVALVGVAAGLGLLIAAVHLLPVKQLARSASGLLMLSTSVLILSGAMKIISTLSWSELAIGLVGMAGGLTALVVAVRLLPTDTALRSAGLIGMAVAMGIIAAVLKKMGGLSWGEIARGLVTFAGSLLILSGALALMKSAIPGAISLLIIAPALIVIANAMKKMSGLSWGEIGKGLTVLASSLLIISGAMYLMSSALPGAAALLVVSASLVILGGVMKNLGDLSWEEIAKGLVAMAGAFTVLGLAGLVLAEIIPVILALAASVALMGVGFVTTGAGLVMMGAGIASIAAALATSGGAIVVFVSSLVSLIPYIIEQIGVGIVRLCEVISGSASAICKAVSVIISAIVEAIVTSVPTIAEGLLQLILSLLTALKDYIPLIAETVYDYFISVLNVMAKKLPEVTQAVVDLLMALFQGVIDALSSVDMSVLIDGIKGIGLLSALILALALVARAIPAAMIGVIGLGLVVAELGIVLSELGKLSQSPGLKMLISEGGDLLQLIGTAIGKFLGGIVGGYAQGATSALPQVGRNLSLFMSNASVFLDGVRSIDSSVLKGVGALTGVIIALTAANILEGIASFVTGRSSITSFAEGLPALGYGLASFSDAVDGINVENIKAASIAAGALAKMADTIPNEGGVASWFAGDNSIASFGEQLPKLGKGLKGFSTSVEGINPENIKAASIAAKAITEMADTIPNEGGVASWFAGDNSIANFGDQLPKLGKGLKGFSTSVEGINPENIKAAALATAALTEMADTIPNEGGVASWFAGDNSIASFGEQLLALGKGLSDYSIAVEGINAENISSATNAAVDLAKMADTIPNEGGVVSWFTGDNSIANFGDQLPKLGKGLKGFSDSVEGINAENVKVASSAAVALVKMADIIPNEGGVVSWFTGDNSIANFGDKLPKLGKGLKGFSDSIEGINAENVKVASSAAIALAKMADTIPNEGGVVAWFTGDNSIANFGEGIAKLGKGLKSFSASVEGINAENVKVAASAAISLAKMADTIPNEGGVVSWFTGDNSIANFGDQLPKLGKGLKSFSASVEGINAENVKIACSAAKVLAKMADTIPNEGGVVSWFTGDNSIANFSDQLPKLGKGLKGFSDSIEGINAENVKAAASAAKALAKMANTIPNEGGMAAWFTGDNSVANFGGKLPTLGKGLKGFSDSVKGINPENIMAASKAAKNLASMASTTPKNTDKIIDFGTNLVTFGGKLNSFFSKTKGVTSESASSVSKAISSIKSAVNGLKNSSVNSASKSIDSIVKSLKKMSKVSENTTSGFVSAMKKLGETNVSALVKSFKSGESKVQNAGKSAMDAFIRGVNAKANAVKSAANKVASNAAGGTKTYYSNFYNAGSYLVQGFASGINASTWRAEAKARAMANAAEKAAKEALDINSPSKVFRAIGYSVPEGFAMGIDRMIGLVTGSSKDMAVTAVGTVKSAIAKVSDIVNSDIDAQPTIRPVLDLSAVSAGAGAINGMLGFTPSIGVLSNVRAINSMMNRNQNGTNKDVVSAIKDLEATIGKTSGDTYTINGVTYSEGSDVSDAVKTLVRAVTVGGRK